jgi:methylated-DNA-[protein]-cysteine S-methyltransferase
MRERPMTETNLSSPTARDKTTTSWSKISTPLGQLFIATNSRGLCAIQFGCLESDLRSRSTSRAPIDGGKSLLHQVCTELQEYFLGRRTSFDLPVYLSSLTPFQREVLAVTSRIPWGEVWSYHRVAQEMGRPKASRPVGQALSRNPIPIVIPCHRVVASDGGLGGYCGKTGLKLKRLLLRHEGAQL